MYVPSTSVVCLPSCCKQSSSLIRILRQDVLLNCIISGHISGRTEGGSTKPWWITHENSPTMRIYFSLGGMEQRRKHLDGRGLARAVRSEKCEYFAVVHGKRNVIDRRKVAELFGEMMRLYHRSIIPCHSSTLSIGTVSSSTFSPCTYRPPRSHEATAAMRYTMIESVNVMTSPCLNGVDIRFGKN